MQFSVGQKVIVNPHTVDLYEMWHDVDLDGQVGKVVSIDDLGGPTLYYVEFNGVRRKGGKTRFGLAGSSLSEVIDDEA